MKKIKGSFLFKIKGSDGKVQEWLVDLKSAPGSVTKGSGTASSLGAKSLQYIHNLCRFEGKLHIVHEGFGLHGPCHWQTGGTEGKI